MVIFFVLLILVVLNILIIHIACGTGTISSIYGTLIAVSWAISVSNDITCNICITDSTCITGIIISITSICITSSYGSISINLNNGYILTYINHRKTGSIGNTLDSSKSNMIENNGDTGINGETSSNSCND